MIIRVVRYAVIKSRSKRKHLHLKQKTKEYEKVVDDYDYKVILTSDNCLTGTDRVCEGTKKLIVILL